MTASERARHASLVRWGKENPLAARLMALREKKRAKGKAKGKGKGKTPKPTPAEREAARAKQMVANVAAVGDALNASDNAVLSKNGLNGLISAANGEEPPKNVAQGLIDSGLAVRGEDGRYRLTADGQAIVRAAESGDTSAVLDRLSAVNDKNKVRAEKEKAKEEKQGKGGGGGGGSPKETDEEKAKKKEGERAQNRAKTAEEVGLSKEEADFLAGAASGTLPEGSFDASNLRDLGLVEDTGDTTEATDAGRRALTALERGDVRGYRAAVQDAKRQKEREQAKKERDAEKDQGREDREAGRQAREKQRAREKEERRQRLVDIALERISGGKRPSDTALADLEDAGLVEVRGDAVVLTDAGKKRLQERRRTKGGSNQGPTRPPVSTMPVRPTKALDMDAVYRRYHEVVTMSASELAAWAETDASRRASLDRSPIRRNLRLLHKPKAAWTAADARDANRTIAFISRMRGAEQGEPVSKDVPYSKRDIALRNWGYKAQGNAPNYRMATEADRVADKLCGTCVHARPGDYCRLFDFVFTPGMVCDAWETEIPTMSLAPEVVRALITQVTLERQANAAYLGIATWADAQAFPGLQGWANAAAVEEMQHAQRFIDYLNDRAVATFEAIEAPPSAFPSYAEALTAALRMEQAVSRNLQLVVTTARTVEDEATALLAGEYLLREQVPAEKEIAIYMQKARRTTDLDLLDHELFEG